LANIPQDSSAMTPEAMSILPRFSHTSGAVLEAHRVPSHIVAFVVQHRDQLLRAALEEYGLFRATLERLKIREMQDHQIVMERQAEIDRLRSRLDELQSLERSSVSSRVPTLPPLRFDREPLVSETPHTMPSSTPLMNIDSHVSHHIPVLLPRTRHSITALKIDQAAAFQGRIPPQLIPNHTQLHLSREGLTQTPGKPNTLQPTQMNNSVGLLARPPTPQSMGASSMSSMGTRITGAGSSGRAQSLSGSMSAPMSAPLTQAGMNGAPSSILTQSAGAVPIRQPTAEEVCKEMG
jgi:hypothetical protein